MLAALVDGSVFSILMSLLRSIELQRWSMRYGSPLRFRNERFLKRVLINLLDHVPSLLLNLFALLF